MSAAANLRQHSVKTDVVEILERILHKGIVIDAWGRASLAAMDLVRIESIVVASLETHFGYANEPVDVGTSAASELDGSHAPTATERASLRIVHKAFDAWNFHDVEGYVALLDNGYVGETHRDPTPLRGPEAVRRALEAYFEAFPGLHFTIERAFTAGDDVLVSWLATRAARSADCGADLVAPPAQVRGCTVTRLQGRKIVHTWSYWDTSGSLQPTAIAPR